MSLARIALEYDGKVPVHVRVRMHSFSFVHVYEELLVSSGAAVGHIIRVFSVCRLSVHVYLELVGAQDKSHHLLLLPLRSRHHELQR